MRNWLALLLVFLAGCATSFTGDAHFPNGPEGCSTKCRAQGMEMGAFVYAGAYSDACVCQPKGKVSVSRAGGVSAGIVGVILQMQRLERERQAALRR